MTSGRPLARDTAVEVERQQIEQWREMSSADKAALISGLTNATFVRGRDLAERAFPDARSRPEP